MGFSDTGSDRQRCRGRGRCSAVGVRRCRRERRDSDGAVLQPVAWVSPSAWPPLSPPSPERRTHTTAPPRRPAERAHVASACGAGSSLLAVCHCLDTSNERTVSFSFSAHTAEGIAFRQPDNGPSPALNFVEISNKQRGFPFPNSDILVTVP